LLFTPGAPGLQKNKIFVWISFRRPTQPVPVPAVFGAIVLE